MSLLNALAAGGADEKLWVDDVFSTFLYTGNGSTQTINNGIDLAGKGGLVWLKGRDYTTDHNLTDTARGAGNALASNATFANSGGLGTSAFNSNGFSIHNGDMNNYLNRTFTSWTFRKAPKFFDIVTYTGDGTSNRQIAHNLGCEVGMIMTKATSTTGDWNTYHRSATGDLVLNTTAAQTGSKAVVNSATSSTFTVSGAANTNGVTYIAYLFAHDPSADGIIQCGSWVSTGGGNQLINLGWEPQYLLIKRSDGIDNWRVIDNMRGLSMTLNPYLSPNMASAETARGGDWSPSPIGFIDQGSLSAGTYIYLAIRRPNKPPTSGTQVYNAIARTGTGAAATVTGVGFAPDLVIAHHRDYDGNHSAATDRLRGAGSTTSMLAMNQAGVEQNGTQIVKTLNMDGFEVGTDGNINFNTKTYINWNFKRAPGVFDIVCYTGTGVDGYKAYHSLGVIPELIIIKPRNYAEDWLCSFNFTDTTYSRIRLNTTAPCTTDVAYNTGDLYSKPTKDYFEPNGGTVTNASNYNNVAYLFATKAGISKVGSYTGNGSSQNIDCGFTTGARFVLIKRTDSTGDWYVWDTARGIVSANDPHLSLNSTAAEVTTDDSIDPYSLGFTVNQNSATNINVNAATYIYLAFA